MNVKWLFYAWYKNNYAIHILYLKSEKEYGNYESLGTSLLIKQ